MTVMKKVGFKIDRIDYSCESTYLDNCHSMLSYNYKTPMVVAVKPSVSAAASTAASPTT